MHQEPPARRHARRRTRVAAAVLAAAVVGGAVVIGRHTLLRSLASLGQLDLGWFLLAVLCECVSLTAFGLSRRRLLRADGHQATFVSVMAITYAGNALSMSVPFAGAQLAAVFSYRQFRRRGLDPALTGWALAVSAPSSASHTPLMLLPARAAWRGATAASWCCSTAPSRCPTSATRWSRTSWACRASGGEQGRAWTHRDEQG